MADGIFVLQDVDDREHARDGRSLLGAHLAQHPRRFRGWDGAVTRSRVEFAAAAFMTATVPVMCPPYVSTHRRVVYAAPRWDEDGRCGLVIEIATPIAASLADQLPPAVGDWGRDPESGQYFPPEDNDRLTVYGRLTARIPFPVDVLPDPAYTDTGTAEVETAKRALRALTNHANDVLAHLVPVLDGALDGGGPDGNR